MRSDLDPIVSDGAGTGNDRDRAGAELKGSDGALPRPIWKNSKSRSSRPGMAIGIAARISMMAHRWVQPRMTNAASIRLPRPGR